MGCGGCGRRQQAGQNGRQGQPRGVGRARRRVRVAPRSAPPGPEAWNGAFMPGRDQQPFESL
jgi:hypothetical protein